MSNLPEELYLDIFLRLPVKSILTCKCVCKSWFELISDPRFVKSHLNLAFEAKDPSLIFTSYNIRNGHFISSMSYHSFQSASPTEDLYKNSVELDYPFKSERNVLLVGSCNGLVCLRIEESTARRFFCLWNPATTEYKTIPDPPITQYVTFGHDYMADDYILVNVRQQYDCLPMDVYTLRSNQWKSMETDPYKFYLSGYGVFADGTCHCLVETRGLNCSKVIISLDMSNEKLRKLQLPKIEALENNKDLRVLLNVGVLEGCLSLFVHVVAVRWEVWVMGKYGVRESWTKSYVITDSLITDEYFLKPMWSFKNGDILLETVGKHLVIYDTVHALCGELKRLTKIHEKEIYVESLVSVNSGHYVN